MKVNPTRQRKQSAGFTLIEIMVVVVILGILAALIAPNVINRIDDAQAVKARNDVATIVSAINMYRLDQFQYPSGNDGLQVLWQRPQDAEKWPQGGYLPREPKAPWDRPYMYLNPGQRGEYDVYPRGRDGAPGGEGVVADIGNWNLDD